MRPGGRSQVGRRYASALADLTRDADQFQQMERDLEKFSRLLRDRADLRSALFHPGIGKGERENIVERVALSLALDSELSRRFLRLLAGRRRLEFLDDVIESWRRQVEDRLGIVAAEVVVAAPLTDRERERCREVLEGMTGRRVRLVSRTDRGLIGGALARVGSRVYDGSIRRRLARLRGNLVEES